jgi:hypothetical protein
MVRQLADAVTIPNAQTIQFQLSGTKNKTMSKTNYILPLGR